MPEWNYNSTQAELDAEIHRLEAVISNVTREIKSETDFFNFAMSTLEHISKEKIAQMFATATILLHRERSIIHVQFQPK